MRTCLLLALGVAAMAAADETPTRLGLDDAKKFAVQHNLEVLALRRAVEEAQAGLGRARSAYYPKLGVGAGADTQLLSAGSQSAVLAYAYGSYNLFNGFSDNYRSQVAGLEADKAAIRLKRAEFRVGLEVERAFHLYIYKKTTIDLKKEAITLNDTHKRMASQKKAAGMASDSDVMEFDLREATLRSDLLLLEQELDEARNALKRLLGEEVGSRIEPVGALQHQHLKGSLNELLKRIQKESEPVLVGAQDVAIAALEAKRVGAKWLPKLDVDVAAGYLPWDLRQVPAGTAMVGGKIVATFDLFSGFDTLYERREATAKQLRMEAQLKESILATVTDTQNAFRRIATIQSRVDLEERNAQRAKKYYASVLSEYRRGVKNSADLRVAADGVFEAGLRGEAFKFEFLNSRIDLEKALGGKVETDVIEEKNKEG